MPFQLYVALEPAAKGAWNLILDLDIAPGIGWSRRARQTSQPCRRHPWQGFPRAEALVYPLRNHRHTDPQPGKELASGAHWVIRGLSPGPRIHALGSFCA